MRHDKFDLAHVLTRQEPGFSYPVADNCF